MDIMSIEFNARMGSVVTERDMYEGAFDTLDDMTLLDTICKLETVDMRVAAASAKKEAEKRGLVGTIDFTEHLDALVNEAIPVPAHLKGLSPAAIALVVKARTWEGEDAPSETELAYYDEQESVMAEQYGLPVAAKVNSSAYGNTLYSQAIKYAQSLQDEPRQYKISLHVAGHDVEGKWSDHNPRELANQLALFASKGIGFSVEFKY